MQTDHSGHAAHLRGRFFLFCCIDGKTCGGLLDRILALQASSRSRIDVFNLFNWPGPLRFERSWDWRDCDGIIVHGSLAVDGEVLRGLAANMPGGWEQFEGLKLIVPSEDASLSDAAAASARGLGFAVLEEPVTADDLDSQFASFLASQPARMLQVRAARHHVLQICSHEPHRDPRLDWVASHSPDGVSIHTLGCSHRGIADNAEDARVADNGRLVITEDLTRFHSRTALWSALTGELTGAASEIWIRLAVIGSQACPRSETAGQPFFMDARDADFTSLCRHFALNAAATIHAAMRFEKIDAIIATDLDSLVPACVLKALWKVPLIYDSHEFWSESFPRFAAWEREFWRKIESRLLPECDAVFTVSDPLADLMSGIFGVPVGSVPNCEPFAGRAGIEEKGSQAPDDQTVFLYMGNYAEDRGLEKLVRLWPLTPDGAVLHLRGHKVGIYSELEALARESGLLDTRIFFFDPVTEAEMVSASRHAHVGLIPYEAIGPNNKFCCPNKLSQYCAAGLAILANKLDFVEQCVRRGENGMVADITNAEEFAAAVAVLAQDRSRLLLMKQNSLRFHEQAFNWQEAGKPLYSALERLLKASDSAGEDRETCFRSISGRGPLGRWNGSAVSASDAVGGSPHEEREAYIKSLHHWMDRRDQKIATLQKEKEALKAEIKERKKKKPAKKTRLFPKLLKRLTGRR